MPSRGSIARLKAAREALGLSQRQLAARLKVDPTTIWKWEKGLTQPPIRFWPRILVIVGLDDQPADAPWSEKIKGLRRAHGLTQAQFGTVVGVRQTKVSEWELGLADPSPQEAKRTIGNGP